MSGFKIDFAAKFANQPVEAAQTRLAKRCDIAHRDLTGEELIKELMAANTDYQAHVAKLTAAQ